MDQSVADAPNRFDPARFTRVVAQFAAQVRHVDLNGVHQCVEQIKLGACQLQFGAVHLRGPVPAVQDQAVDLLRIAWLWTALTTIPGYLEMVLDDPGQLSPEVRNYLTIASRNVDRLSSLVADLLTTDSVTLQVSRTDVAQLVADSLGSAAPAAENNKVTLDSQVQAPLEAFIDGRRIGQVLDNLVSNAVKYSPDGGAVTVRAWAEGADLWCEVQDTGMGMNSEEQGEVFTKFFRARSAVQRSSVGWTPPSVLCCQDV